jgi:hypothetical protein
MTYEGNAYVILFRGGETRRGPFASGDVRVESAVGDPELDRVKQAVREVLGDEGWLDVDLELGKRWVGGTLRLIPGKEGYGSLTTFNVLFGAVESQFKGQADRDG